MGSTSWVMACERGHYDEDACEPYGQAQAPPRAGYCSYEQKVGFIPGTDSRNSDE